MCQTIILLLCILCINLCIQLDQARMQSGAGFPRNDLDLSTKVEMLQLQVHIVECNNFSVYVFYVLLCTTSWTCANCTTVGHR